MSRRVSIDDTNTQIRYNGSWVALNNETEDPNNSGPPFLSTLHGVRDRGSLSFTFSGRDVAAWGVVKPRGTASARDPTWQCLLDGKDIGLGSTYPNAEIGNYMLCSAENLPQGQHTLVMNVVSGSADSFYLDQIDYVPGPGVNSTNGWVAVFDMDPSFTFSSGWQYAPNSMGRYTTTKGASITYNFIGDSIIWGGLVPVTQGVTSEGSATYTIDGKNEKSFKIPTSRSVSLAWVNQQFFSVTGLKPGAHRLTVTNQGGATSAPLGVSYIYTKVTGTGSTSGGGGGGGSGGSSGGGGRRRGAGRYLIPILGAVIGALLLLTLALWCLRRFKRKQEGKGAPTAPQTPWGIGKNTEAHASLLQTQGKEQVPNTLYNAPPSPPPPNPSVWQQPQYVPYTNSGFAPQVNQGQVPYQQGYRPYAGGYNQNQFYVVPQGPRDQGHPNAATIPMQTMDGMRDGGEFNPYRRT